MKKSIRLLSKLILSALLIVISCENTNKRKNNNPKKTTLTTKKTDINPLDSTLVPSFFEQHLEFKKFEKEVTFLYQKQHYNYIWFDDKGIKEVGYLLYNKAAHLSTEGISSKIPYQSEYETVFREENDDETPEIKSELLISCLYFYYTDKVYKGLAHLILKNDPNWPFEKIEKAMQSGVEKWYALPRKIPVYIGYFTTWVTKDGTIHFYDDVYQRDERLANMLLDD